ncbi:hypothetical protein AtubIFM57258_008093 [Aspergillus tubingensis]|nr:hypothetical protein AtubIFM57258_008093 [Aspergillus tubingensis]
MVVHAIKTYVLLIPLHLPPSLYYCLSGIKNINFIIFRPAEFTEKVINSKKQAVVFFFAIWAGSCKMMRPVFEKFSKDYPSIEFYDVDVDNLRQLSEDLGNTTVPTFLFFKDGAQLNNLTVPGAYTQNLMNSLAALS